MGGDEIDYDKEYFILLDKYNELIYAVERKFDNETRHQTALRYIRETERRTSSESQSAKVVAPWVEPKFEKKEWYTTPLVPETKNTKEK